MIYVPSHLPKDAAPATAAATGKPRPKRYRLTDFAASFWQAPASLSASSLPTLTPDAQPYATSDAQQSARPDADALASAVAEQPARSATKAAACSQCHVSFDDFVAQRAHWRSDWHKFNLRRVARGLSVVSESAFDRMSDLGSIESLSASEDDASDEEDGLDDDGASLDAMHARTALVVKERIEFRHVPSAAMLPPSARAVVATAAEQRPPSSDAATTDDSSATSTAAAATQTDSVVFVVLYRAALPDTTTLASLASRGSWAVIMSGSGHFVAAIWDADATLCAHKTFHRYTSRRKQGGSQAIADEARGNANRIRSAGATLRRYGEQALQTEVHDLLRSWHDKLDSAQCIFIRASCREKRDLLLGWDGSPLKSAAEGARVRNIPFPTRRATLKEAQRVYEVLSTVNLSPVSLLAEEAAAQQRQRLAAKLKAVPQSSKQQPQQQTKPTDKGTDHLKKRDDKPKPQPMTDVLPSQPTELPLDDALFRLMRLCLDDDREQLAEMLRTEPVVKDVTFEKRYFPSEDERFQTLDADLGLVGVAAVSGSVPLVEFFLDEGVSPTTGFSPYIANKSKQMRTALRKYWGRHPDRYDYAKAEIPGPISDAEVEAQAERERQKRKKERLKKKEKVLEKTEAAKPPEQRARELRAAAAEARLLGNRCANCHKSLQGITPFQRLSYKYCSTNCVNKHRQVLSLL